MNHCVLKSQSVNLKPSLPVSISTPKCPMIFFLKCMSRITDSVLINHEDLAFVGDMNCCHSKSDTIRNVCDVYDLNNLINDPTCFKA